MGIQTQSFVMDIIRVIFSFLDKLVYGLVKWILFGIFDIVNITANSDVFSGIYARIYVILGIFMAFKLSFSFFQYIIDPESMTGKSDKSLAKVFTRVFVMLAALIFLPMILFGQNGQEGLLSRAQKAFLPSLPKIIFGVNDVAGVNSNNFSNSVEQSADEITVTMLKGFFAPPEELDQACGDGTLANTPEIKSIDDMVNNINISCNKKGDVVIGGSLFHTGTKFYKYSYILFISTVVGVLIAALLLGITLDLAKRIFKLLILEVIAPIPIMSLIDPKGSKDGAFGKWSKSLITTFLDIFLKMGLVYIIIVLIHLIVNAQANGGLFNNMPQNSGFRGVYLTIILILGLILFAKEAPKFIKEAMGLKSDGAGLFDDVKAVGKAAGLVGGAAVGTAGVIGSTVGNVRAQMQGNRENFEGQHVRNSLRNIGAALSGAVGGTAAMASGLTGKDAGLKSVLKKQQERNAKSFDYRRNGGTLFGGLGSSARQAFTGESAYDAMERGWKREEEAIKVQEAQLKPLQDANAHRKTIMDRASSKAKESIVTNGTFSLNGRSYSGNYRAYSSAYNAAVGSGAGVYERGGEKYFQFNGQEINLKDGESIGMGLLDENAKDYYARAYADHSFDGTIGNAIELYEEGTGTNIENSLGNVKASYGANSREISRRSNVINRNKQRISDARQSNEATRAKANSSRYRAGSK